MDFANYDESFTKVQALYNEASDAEKTEMNQLCMDATGGIFEDRERMASHFAGLNSGDFEDIMTAIKERFPHLM